MNDIFIYDQIGEGLLSGVTLKDVQNQLDKNAKEVTVHINSGGGDVREGFAIHDFLVNSGKKITTIIEGKCYSIATVIFLAGSDRQMQENAELMIHNPWGMAEGDAEQLEKYTDWIKENEERLAAFYVEKTGIDLDTIKSMMKETTFMDADEAINKNFATAKVEPMKAVALINNKMQDFSEEQKSTLKKFFDGVENLFKARGQEEPKNMLVKLDDGSELFIESEDDTLMGKKVFKVNEGQKTEDAASDGVYTLESGVKITVAGGIISAVEEEAQDDIEALKAEIETLKAENKSLKEGAESVQAELDEEKEKVTEVQNSFNELKKQVFGTPPVKKERKEHKSNATDSIDEHFEALGKQIINHYQ